MNRLACVAPLAVLVALAAVGCNSSSLPGSCGALEACCSQTDDPSSCSETATDTTDAAVCTQQLAQYQAQGLCAADGGAIGPSSDGGHG